MIFNIQIFVSLDVGQSLSRDLSYSGGMGLSSSKSADRNWVQVCKNDDENRSATDSKNGNAAVIMVSERSAVATGSTVSGSAASIKFMASHMRAPGSKNYIQKSVKHLKSESKESFQSDESARQTYSTAPQPVAVLSTQIQIVHEDVDEDDEKDKIDGSIPLSFRPQKDKRQKIDIAPTSTESNVNVMRDPHQPTSCLIRPKSTRIESLYAIHQQQSLLRPPAIIIKRISPDDEKPKEVVDDKTNRNRHPAMIGLENAIAAASAGVRMFHGLNQIPNLSDEEGNAADWIGHVMSSTSAPVEVSVENSKKHNEMSPDSAGISVGSECPRSKWGTGPLDTSEVMSTTKRLDKVTTGVLEQSYDCATSYRDRAMIVPARVHPPSDPSGQISALTPRSRPTSIMKKNSASSFSDWQQADHKRPGRCYLK